jgi:hypothetical protein
MCIRTGLLSSLCLESGLEVALQRISPSNGHAVVGIFSLLRIYKQA